VAKNRFLLCRKKIFIKEVYIQGNKTFSDDEIKKIITTTPKNWLSWLFEGVRSRLTQRAMLLMLNPSASVALRL